MLKISLENKQIQQKKNNSRTNKPALAFLPSNQLSNSIPFMSNNFLTDLNKNSITLSEKKDNLIIGDIFKCKRFISTSTITSRNLIHNGLSIEKERIVDDKGKHFVKIVIKDGEKVILEATKGISHKNIKIGLFIGKSGTYGMLELCNPAKYEENYIAIIPQGSEIKTGDGLSIKVFDPLAPKNSTPDITFKGSNACTVNIMFRPRKTKKSIAKFQEMLKVINYPYMLSRDKEKYKKNYYPYILAGGFGTRLGIITLARKDNKPSSPVPAKNCDLINFTLLNLHKVGLFDEHTDVNYYEQIGKVGPAGCFVEALGYTIVRNKDGLKLKKIADSQIPDDKNTIILAADTVTDIDYSSFLDKFNATPDAGVMLVGIPVSEDLGGIIAHDENNLVYDFIEAPRPNTNDADAGLIKRIDEHGNVSLKLNKNNQQQYLGNAFIHIIKPELHEVIKDIYQEKINNSYNKVLKDKNGNTGLITNTDYEEILDCVWGRDIIPRLVKMAAEGKLLDANKKPLKIYTHVSDDGDWCDVGKFSKYMTTMQEIADGTKYNNLPTEVKDEIRSNIDGQVIYTTDVKTHFRTLIGEGFTKGPILILKKED